MPNPKTSEPGLVGLKALAEKATAGPWAVQGRYTTPQRVWTAPAPDEGELLCDMRAGSFDQQNRDAAYIAAASPDVILNLLSRLLAAEAERDRLRGALEPFAKFSLVLEPAPGEPNTDYLDTVPDDAQFDYGIGEHGISAGLTYGDFRLAARLALSDTLGGEKASSAAEQGARASTLPPGQAQHSAGLAHVLAEDLIALAETVGEHQDMQDGPCEDVCCSWFCQQAGCVKDKADRARLFLSSEELRRSPSEASAATSPADEQKDTPPSPSAEGPGS